MKIVGKIFAVLYTIVFSVFLLAFSLILPVSNGLNASFFSGLLNTIELSEIKAKDLGFSDDPNISLEDALVDTIAEMGIDKNVAKEIMENEEIKDLAGNLLEKFVNYTINPEEVPQISREEVETVLNNSAVKEVMDSSISSEDIDEIVKEANKALKEMCKDGGVNFEF